MVQIACPAVPGPLPGVHASSAPTRATCDNAWVLINATGQAGAGTAAAGALAASCSPAGAGSLWRCDAIRRTRFTRFQLARSAGSSASTLARRASITPTSCRPDVREVRSPLVAPLTLPRDCARSLTDCAIASAAAVSASTKSSRWPGEIAGSLPGKVSDREVESALRLLIKAGAIRSEPESGGLVFVRLPATAERIKRDLGPADATRLELLRALWRAAGDSLYDGAAVDLDALTQGLGGAPAATPLLEALEQTQSSSGTGSAAATASPIASGRCRVSARLGGAGSATQGRAREA
jgi:hypothetical protein